MTLNHLETMTSTQSHSSRKSQRVYRSPSDPNEPSPFSKEKKRDSQQLQHSDNNKLMEIDAEDAEAGNILMALKNHQFNMNPSSSSSSTYDEKPTRSNSMSISNLLDSESDSSMLPPHISPYHSLSSESKPLFHHNEARRNSVKKGFQICITPRRSSTTRIDHHHHIHKSPPLKSFRPANSVRIPINGKSKSHLKYKRNTIHIHISYRIHAHRASLSSRPIYERYETSPYPSAFRAPPQSQAKQHSPYHYQQDLM